MIGPQALAAKPPPAPFYRGGTQIAAFRGTGQAAPNTPEDWVASTTSLFGADSLGLSRLPSGELLVDAIHRDPAGWLGPDHVRRFGADTALLVKLLDAGERLPVHAHPDVPFAQQHLALGHGKTEAWVFLEPGEARLGFARDVGAAELAQWVSEQDVPAMLAAMHTLAVERGDAVFVPAGLPHAIGAGCFLVELQEPTDLSILIEWDGFDIDGRRDGHLGLGHETALGAVDRRKWDVGDIEQLRSARAADTGDLFPAGAPFFRASRSRGPSAWEAGYGVVVATGGSGRLVFGDGDVVLPTSRGDTVVVPFAAGPCRVEGDQGFEVLRCQPPMA
jgi:mannose-6-phosphate isomerase